MPLWSLHDISGDAHTAAIMVRGRCEKTGRPLWLIYRVPRIQRLAEAASLVILWFAAAVIFGFGLAIGWAWGSTWWPL